MRRDLITKKKKTEENKKRFLELYRKCLNKRKVCKAMRIHHSTFYDWQDKDAAFAEKIKAIEREEIEELKDLAKDVLREKLKKKRETLAAIYVLNSQGKDEGWGEKSTHEIGGINISIERVIIPDRRPVEIEQDKPKEITHEQKD